MLHNNILFTITINKMFVLFFWGGEGGLVKIKHRKIYLQIFQKKYFNKSHFSFYYVKLQKQILDNNIGREMGLSLILISDI